MLEFAFINYFVINYQHQLASCCIQAKKVRSGGVLISLDAGVGVMCSLHRKLALRGTHILSKNPGENTDS